MSGHSKWSQIKRQKGATDAKRGQAFGKLIGQITVAAKQGGGDPSSNLKLRLLVEAARKINMPKENIERAIARGTGKGDGAAVEEVHFEGYGPGGIAWMADGVTDNRNRTLANLKAALNKHGGRLGGAGSVNYLFHQKGVILASGDDLELLEMSAIDAGADDIDEVEKSLVVTVAPEMIETVKTALEAAGATVESAEISMEPQSPVVINEAEASQAHQLLDAIEALEDITSVTSNLELHQQ